MEAASHPTERPPSPTTAAREGWSEGSGAVPGEKINVAEHAARSRSTHSIPEVVVERDSEARKATAVKHEESEAEAKRAQDHSALEESKQRTERARRRPDCQHVQTPCCVPSRSAGIRIPSASGAGSSAVPRDDLSTGAAEGGLQPECLECFEIDQKEEKVLVNRKIIAEQAGLLPTEHPFTPCEHYERMCYLECSTCEKYYPCRRCHDENEKCEFKRHETKAVACSHCGAADQPVAEHCGSCKRKFADYFCSVCRFYDTCAGGAEPVYHCVDCGICRIGSREDNFHCSRCNSCVPIDVKDSHPCMVNALERDCPVCLEYMATSIDQVVYMKCGHAMHGSCFDLYTKKKYTCPLCHQALTDMSQWYKALEATLAAEEMPIEFARKRSLISCYDCKGKSVVPFHFQFLQCGVDECRGFNTFTLGSAPNASDEDVQAEMERRIAVVERAAKELKAKNESERET